MPPVIPDGPTFRDLGKRQGMLAAAETKLPTEPRDSITGKLHLQDAYAALVVIMEPRPRTPTEALAGRAAAKNRTMPPSGPLASLGGRGRG